MVTEGGYTDGRRPRSAATSRANVGDPGHLRRNTGGISDAIEISQPTTIRRKIAGANVFHARLFQLTQLSWLKRSPRQLHPRQR